MDAAFKDNVISLEEFKRKKYTLVPKLPSQTELQLYYQNYFYAPFVYAAYAMGMGSNVENHGLALKKTAYGVR